MFRFGPGRCCCEVVDDTIPCTACAAATPILIKVYNSSTGLTKYAMKYLAEYPCYWIGCGNDPYLTAHAFPLVGGKYVCHQEYTTGSITYTPLWSGNSVFGNSGLTAISATIAGVSFTSGSACYGEINGTYIIDGFGYGLCWYGDHPDFPLYGSRITFSRNANGTMKCSVNLRVSALLDDYASSTGCGIDDQLWLVTDTINSSDGYFSSLSKTYTLGARNLNFTPCNEGSNFCASTGGTITINAI